MVAQFQNQWIVTSDKEVIKCVECSIPVPNGTCGVWYDRERSGHKKTGFSSKQQGDTDTTAAVTV